MPDREKVLKGLACCTSAEGCHDCPYAENGKGTDTCQLDSTRDALELLKEQEPDASKYQYKIDHTDCIWHSNSKSLCPSTCSQYRDGWNDAMDFIFKNGLGYQPYKRR